MSQVNHTLTGIILAETIPIKPNNRKPQVVRCDVHPSTDLGGGLLRFQEPEPGLYVVDAFTTSPRRRPGIFCITETFDGDIFPTDDVVKMRRETCADDSTH